MTFKLYLTDADYTTWDGRTAMRLYGRTDKGKSAIVIDTDFEPYFYIITDKDPKDAIKAIQKKELKDDSGNTLKIERTEIVEKTVDLEKKKVIRIVAQQPSDVPKIKDILKDLPFVKDKREFDIPYFRRYLYDKRFTPMTWLDIEGESTDSKYSCDITLIAKGIKKTEDTEPPKDLRILAFDLETVPADDGMRQKIIMASVATGSGTEKVITYGRCTDEKTDVVDDEKALIEALSREICKEKPDFIVTYNGDAFDFEVLKQRADKYNIQLCLGFNTRPITFQRRGMINAAVTKGSVHIDLYQFVSRIMRATVKSDAMKLDNIAEELIGENKLDFDFEEMFDIWDKGEDVSKIARYNMHDSRITLKLAEYLLPNIAAMCHLTRLAPFDASRATYGQLVESFALKKASKMGVIVPNKPSQDTMSERKKIGGVEGAFVVEPKPGLHKDIAVLDFRSLYPSIIVSHNISPETMITGCKDKDHPNKVPGFDQCFDDKNKGFIPSILKELLEGRIGIKKEMKSIDKDTQQYRLLDKKQYAFKTVANSFYGYLGFAGSRWYRRECAESVTAFGRDYIHKTIKEAEKAGFETIYGDTDSLFLLLKESNIGDIKAFLKRINDKLPGMMELEFEGRFRTGIFVTKKSGKGGAKKRYALMSDTGELKVRGFERVRRDWSDIAKDTQQKVMELVLDDRKDEAITYVKQIIDMIKSGKADMDSLIINNKITMPLSRYAQVGPHVAAARKAVSRGDRIEPGMVVQYIITKGSGSISERAELAKYAKDYDPDYYLNNQVIPSALRVLSAVGVTKDQLLNKGVQKGLFSFSK